MRLDIPQDITRRREPASESSIPRSPDPTSVQRHVQSLKGRAAQADPASIRRSAARVPSQPVLREREAVGRIGDARRVNDPRENTGPRRTRRDHLPSQTIGVSLRAEERKVMLELGRFRVVRACDLADSIYDGKQRKLDEDLRYLRSKGMVETRHINLRRDGMRRQIDRIEVATLTRDGRRWLNKKGDVPERQTVYYGFVKPREMEHDSLIYRAYNDAARRIERDGGTNLRVKLDFEIKADVQKDIHRARKADPKREMADIKQEVAAKHALPFVNGSVQIPDARIEFDRKVEGQEQDQGSRTGGHEDIEVLTAAYGRGHLRAKAQSGFRAYASGADRSTITARIEDDHEMMQDILDL